jgi:dipeptidyl aminopeptidase/acylaminoacyl peptidase
MRSSYDAPNDVFLLERSTQSLRAGDVNETRVTNFYKEHLDGKTMRGGTDIWWTGGAQPDRKIQGWVLTPPGFQKGEIGKYPAIMMIHGELFLFTLCRHNCLTAYPGGPSALWQDIWFPRYNLNSESRVFPNRQHHSHSHWYPAYTNQGYVVFAPNGTGSTSFGQEFQDAIAEDWGGAPFQDMRAGWKEFLSQYPEVDRTRTVGWGASWGGYGVT